MSRPRGNGVQRRIARAARDALEPHGFTVSIDFSTHHGHQKLLVSRDGREVRRFELVGTPRCADTAVKRMLRDCQKLVRDFP